jgi:hypothetical protein
MAVSNVCWRSLGTFSRTSPALVCRLRKAGHIAARNRIVIDRNHDDWNEAARADDCLQSQFGTEGDNQIGLSRVRPRPLRGRCRACRAAQSEVKEDGPSTQIGRVTLRALERTEPEGFLSRTLARVDPQHEDRGHVFLDRTLKSQVGPVFLDRTLKSQVEPVLSRIHRLEPGKQTVGSGTSSTDIDTAASPDRRQSPLRRNELRAEIKGF